MHEQRTLSLVGFMVEVVATNLRREEATMSRASWRKTYLGWSFTDREKGKQRGGRRYTSEETYLG